MLTHDDIGSARHVIECLANGKVCGNGKSPMENLTVVMTVLAEAKELVTAYEKSKLLIHDLMTEMKFDKGVLEGAAKRAEYLLGCVERDVKKLEPMGTPLVLF